ncbi:UPF0758 domain-containing protein [Actinomadura keratinilytica]
MADVPVADRPRERLLDRGAEALSDRELLALLIGSGTGGCDAVELAGQLIARHGGLYELSRTPAHELMAGLPGMGREGGARRGRLSPGAPGSTSRGPESAIRSRIRRPGQDRSTAAEGPEARAGRGRGVRRGWRGPAEGDADRGCC